MIYTIGREFGSGGRETGAELARILGVPLYDKEFIEAAETASGIKAETLEPADERRENRWLYSIHFNTTEDYRGMSANEILFRVQSRLVLEYAEKSDCVIVGRCADYVLDIAGFRHISVFVAAPKDERINRITKLRNISQKEAATLISRIDRQRKSYYEYYTGKSWGKPLNYDLCINSAAFGTENAARAIAEMGSLRK